MTKHVLDRPKTVSTNTLARAVMIERRKRPHFTTLRLQRRSRPRDINQRAQFYTQVLRDGRS